MVKERLSRWGIGPMIAVPSFLYTVAALVISFKWTGVFLLRPWPEAVRLVGAALTGLGVALWLAGAIAAMQAYNRDRLDTAGPFALVRNPMYSGWITLAFPGLALYFGSWPMFLTPVMAYSIFRRFIRREDEYLEDRFGQAYRDYRKRVNAVVPIPKSWFKRR